MLDRAAIERDAGDSKGYCTVMNRMEIHILSNFVTGGSNQGEKHACAVLYVSSGFTPSLAIQISLVLGFT